MDGGFTASTLAMSDADARAGRTRFAVDGAAPGALNAGWLLAAMAMWVLVAPSVEGAQSAVIEAPNGAVILAAGKRTSRVVAWRVLPERRHAAHAESGAGYKYPIKGRRGDAGHLRHSGCINKLAMDGGRVINRK